MNFRCELKRVVDDSYDIQIGRDLGDTLAADLKGGLCGRPSRIAVVSDSNVAPLYAGEILEKLRAAGFTAELFTIPAGEKSKTRAMKEQVEDAMLAHGCRRDCAVVAVGGGVAAAEGEAGDRAHHGPFDAARRGPRVGAREQDRHAHGEGAEGDCGDESGVTHGAHYTIFASPS